MTEHVLGLTCVNCGGVVQRDIGRGIGYATEVSLCAPGHVGETRGIASATFAVARAGVTMGPAMLLCDGCMGAAVKAVCESVLSDMAAMIRDGVVS